MSAFSSGASALTAALCGYSPYDLAGTVPCGITFYQTIAYCSPVAALLSAEQAAYTAAVPTHLATVYWCSEIDPVTGAFLTPAAPPGAGSPPPPPYTGSPFTPPPTINPIADVLAGAGAAVGLSLLAGIGAIVGAPVLAAASSAAALTAGLLTAAGLMSSPPTAQAALSSAGSPLAVILAPAAGTPAAPVVGAPTVPTIGVDPFSGKFMPTSGSLNVNDGSGGWALNTIGGWDYTPPATVQNPTPSPVASITDGGFGLQQIASSSTTGSVYVQRFSDGSVVITNSGSVPVTTSAGTPTTLGTSLSTAYSSSGAPFTGTPNVYVSPVLGNGAAYDLRAPLTVNAGGGGAGAGGTGFPTDYNREVTQQSIKAAIDSINAKLDGSAYSRAPNANDDFATVSAAENKKITDELAGAVSAYNNFKLLDWSTWIPTLPAAPCSPVTGSVMGKTVSFDLCPYVIKLNELIGWLLSIFAAWSIVSMMFRKD